MGMFDENVEKVMVLFLFLIDYNNVGCLEMLGVGGPDWVHRYQKNNSPFIKLSHFNLIDIIKKTNREWKISNLIVFSKLRILSDF